MNGVIEKYFDGLISILVFVLMLYFIEFLFVKILENGIREKFLILIFYLNIFLVFIENIYSEFDYIYIKEFFISFI